MIELGCIILAILILGAIAVYFAFRRPPGGGGGNPDPDGSSHMHYTFEGKYKDR